MQAGEMYLFRSQVVARDTYFETIDDCKLFQKLVDEHLREYLTLLGFQFNRHGWNMLVMLRSKEDIIAAHRRKCEKNSDRKTIHEEPWRIISEQVKDTLSTFVIVINNLRNRQGAKVRQVYERFSFDSQEEAEEYLKEMELQRIDLSQREDKYRPKRYLVGYTKHTTETSIYMTSRMLGDLKLRAELGMRSYCWVDWSHDLVGQVKDFENNTHPPP